jgi:hypothetical protein
MLGNGKLCIGVETRACWIVRSWPRIVRCAQLLMQSGRSRPLSVPSLAV